MAKKTIKQQYEELAKNGEFFCTTSNCGGIAIVVDDWGEGLLYKECFGQSEHICARWQRIKYTNSEEQRPYFTIYGNRYYLDNFMRCA